MWDEAKGEWIEPQRAWHAADYGKNKREFGYECEYQNLNLVFNTDIGRDYLIKKIGLEESLVHKLPEFGFSSIANILASIKLAKYMNLGKEDAFISVATDGADLYLSELEKTKNNFQGVFDNAACANIYEKYLKEKENGLQKSRTRSSVPSKD